MYTFSKLDQAHFPDFEILFGPRGACGGCWCMFWKLPHKDFRPLAGNGTHQMKKLLVEQGLTPGILAYDGDLGIGWIAVEPRSEFPRLALSRILKRVDQAEVWSVTRFYTAETHRRRGVTVELLLEAINYVASKGGKIIEGYPVDPKDGKAPDPFLYTAMSGAYKATGIGDVARFSPTRPIFRFLIQDKTRVYTGW